MTTTRPRLSIKNIASLLLAVYVIPTLLLLLRQGSDNAAYLLELMPYPINRDSSLNNLYYVFSSTGMYDDDGTTFTNIIRLISTGFLPSTIFGEHTNDYIDVTKYLADKRFGWKEGTLHPTLFGWIFIDMKWIGVVFAAFLGIVLGIYTRIYRVQTYVRIGLYCLASIFIIVSMRGSVQFAYSVLVYGVLFLAAIQYVLKSSS
jgi:hypothetical protein